MQTYINARFIRTGSTRTRRTRQKRLYTARESLASPLGGGRYWSMVVVTFARLKSGETSLCAGLTSSADTHNSCLSKSVDIGGQRSNFSGPA